jgi:hypothetical protein
MSYFTIKLNIKLNVFQGSEINTDQILGHYLYIATILSASKVPIGFSLFRLLS